MLAKRIIPCLDVNNGRVVKGVNFVNLRDAGDPVELATFYSQQGADEIVFLDITATYENRQTIADVVRRTAQQVFVPLTVGVPARTWNSVRAATKSMSQAAESRQDWTPLLGQRKFMNWVQVKFC